MSEPTIETLIDDVREAVSNIETGCHPLSDSKRYGHAHDDLSTALEAIVNALTLATQRAKAAEERLMKMTAVAELHAVDVDRLIAERDALRKVNDAMIERAYAVMHRCYGERVTVSKWDIRDALHAALAVQP